MNKCLKEPLLSRLPVVSFFLFLASLLQGSLQLTSVKHFGPGYEMVAIARNLAKYGAFANPFLALPTGPTAANPPLYPVFLWVLFKVFKDFKTIFFAAQFGCVLANAITSALLPLVSLVLFGDAVAGIAASVFWLFAMPMMPSWDTSYTVAALLFFCFLTASSIRKTQYVITSGLLSGTLAGLIFLLNPSALLIMAPWIVFLWLREPRDRAVQLLKYTLSLLLSLCLIGSVWAYRNYRELGAFVVRTNLGMTLYASNNNCAESSLIKEKMNGCYQEYHPNVSVTEAELLRTLGEVEYDRKRIVDTKSWISANPNRFIELTKTRFMEFWFPPIEEFPVKAYAIWITTGLSLVGLAMMVYRREAVVLFMLGVLAIYPLMYYAIVSDVRYRYPVLWISLLAAGYCIDQLI
jgi:hypothetical protein